MEAYVRNLNRSDQYKLFSQGPTYEVSIHGPQRQANYIQWREENAEIKAEP